MKEQGSNFFKAAEVISILGQATVSASFFVTTLQEGAQVSPRCHLDLPHAALFGSLQGTPSDMWPIGIRVQFCVFSAGLGNAQLLGPAVWGFQGYPDCILHAVVGLKSSEFYV